ncbi:hypothetical protein FIV01_08495 [Vibrio aquimaris]|jgi:hypothetical protein|uniref:Uncharacterized protein n=1 Tax=Vibrio aquimaris TaxID=2587862 RepID=A0A5P9CJP6_9VIBR|nr:hypothetical protein FIV01_08495 [Vibrio aquimaris]
MLIKRKVYVFLIVNYSDFSLNHMRGYNINNNNELWDLLFIINNLMLISLLLYLFNESFVI